MDAPNERELIVEFFNIFPDYELCHTSAQNVISGITSYERARQLMWQKAEGAKLNRREIQERLDSKKVYVGKNLRMLRDMTLQEIIHLPDPAFEEVLKFYLKHPYAHSRVGQSRLIPRFLRTLFFRQLIGQAMIRKLEVDIRGMFDLMSML